MMDDKTLLLQYQALLAENKALKEEVLSLKAQLVLAEPVESQPCPEGAQQDVSRTEISCHLHANSDSMEKIRLFMSLFKGRDDQYAKRWESRDGESGYAPVCLNEWKPGICRKPEVRCAVCKQRSFAALDQKAVEAHLRGYLVAGIYPLLQDERCHFLAMDFDKDGWQQDVSVLRDVCKAFEVPVAIERSRSGLGAHAWYFFTDPIAASLARRFGSALLTHAMNKRHQIKFKSYDRFFPNQDTMPKGGFIIFMHCGPIRYRADAKKEAEKRPFDHYVIPRFTGFRAPFDKEEQDISIQELYSGIATDELRNRQITDDVIRAHATGRNALILTERTAHVALLVGSLREKIPDVMALTGGRGRKETGNVLQRIAETPADVQLTLVATGRYIGEGFDEPRLDTLFLAMPISWKGTLQQYSGRLHRLFESKKEVQVYDYVDIHVGALEKMYRKRLAGYAAIGYRAKAESVPDAPADIIFDNTSFLPVYQNDVMIAARETVIVSPFVTKRRAFQMLPNMEAALRNRGSVVVVTRPTNAYREKDRPLLEETFAALQAAGVRLLFKTNIHQKFAVIDRKIVWYGSINFLSYGSAQESIMRLESPNIAQELLKDLGKSIST